MLSLSSERRSYLSPWEEPERRGPSRELILAGVVVVGLGFLAWSYLGADLKRYLKIHAM